MPAFEGGAWPGRDAQNCCLNCAIRASMSLSDGVFTPMLFASCSYSLPAISVCVARVRSVASSTEPAFGYAWFVAA